MAITTLDQLTAIIADVSGLDFDDIERHSNFNDDLGIDSLDFIELTMNVEEHFNIQMSDSHLEYVKTVSDLEQLIIKTL
jgi:acyl carrier protein